MSQRLSVNINDECVAALTDLRDRRGETITEVIRRAISVYKFIEDEVAQGKTIQTVDDTHITTLRLL